MRAVYRNSRNELGTPTVVYASDSIDSRGSACHELLFRQRAS